MLLLCVCRDIEHLESLESTQEARVAASRATLMPLSCSPNFPRAQYLNTRMLTHELILKYIFLGKLAALLALFDDMEKPHVKAARQIHNIPTNHIC